MVQSFDIAILGGGLVGSAMALALSQPGFSVALVDPTSIDIRAAADFDGRTYAVAPGSAGLLRVLGLWQAISELAEPVRGIVVQDRTPGPVPAATLHFDPAETGLTELGWIVEDRILRQSLLAALDGAGVSHLAPAAGTVTERGTGWASIDAGGKPIRARLVVACDGRRSATARTAGIDYLAWGYEQTGLVSAIAHDCPHEGVAHQSFFSGGPFAVLPLKGNRSSLVWSEQADRAREVQQLDDQAYLAEIASRIGGRLGALQLVGSRIAHPLGLSLAQDWTAHRLVVAGDAAHGVHPIAGQGLNMGLRDVAVLAEVLAQAARRGEDIGAQDVLDRYQQWRRPDATLMALGMDALTRGFSTEAAPAQTIRNVGLHGVARSTAARRFFSGVAAGTAGDVPKMLRGLAV